ncbi:MAG: hypothetical protein U0132_18970 [Gemmatimonadaceae bacterium]
MPRLVDRTPCGAGVRDQALGGGSGMFGARGSGEGPTLVSTISATPASPTTNRPVTKASAATHVPIVQGAA